MKNSDYSPVRESNPPGYLFDLIKLSIYAQEGNRQRMSEAVEGALDKGADGKEILKALFRAEKFQQMTSDDQNRLIQKGVSRMVLSRIDESTRIPVTIPLRKKSYKEI